MRFGELGKVYADGERIMRQGDSGEAMYILQAGTAEVIVEGPEGGRRLAILKAGDVFGEMALFDRAPRSATVRAIEGARVLTMDRKGLLRRVHEDPSLAWRILQNMSARIRALDAEVVRLGGGLAAGHGAGKG